MTLGTGIFLSALVLGTVLLFIATKDRWSWKKVFLWPLSIVLGLSILGGLGYYIYSKIPYSPNVQETFWGISLDTTKSDIRFMKGEPFNVIEEATWIYSKHESGRFVVLNPDMYLIKFEEGRIKFVGWIGNSSPAPELQGINIYATSSEIEEKFGKPVRVTVSDDDLKRIYLYEKYHVFVMLEQDRVEGYGIYDPQFGPLEFTEKSGEDTLGKPTPSMSVKEALKEIRLMQQHLPIR